jgi:hypothetical protein
MVRNENSNAPLRSETVRRQDARALRRPNIASAVAEMILGVLFRQLQPRSRKTLGQRSGQAFVAEPASTGAWRSNALHRH